MARPLQRPSEPCCNHITSLRKVITCDYHIWDHWIVESPMRPIADVKSPLGPATAVEWQLGTITHVELRLGLIANVEALGGQS